MDEAYVLTQRDELRMRHYESMVEQDHRLQLIRNPVFVDFDIIVILDKKIANGDKIVKSHPIAIYLNKSALFSEQPNKMNKNLIYKRTKSFLTSNEINKLSMCTNDPQKTMILIKRDNLIKVMDGRKIDPRKRWKKLYDRHPPFKALRELLSAEISNKITQLRNAEPVIGPVKYRNVDCLLRRYETVSRILIYRRCQLKSQHKDVCFPLIWNEPDSSNVFDEVSGDNLCHITLLCRDVICECNTCTTEACYGLRSSCATCKLNLFTETMVGHNQQLSGSFAENCMLPTFYLQTDNKNYFVKKCSDIDVMIYTRRRVGFDMKESNIFATVDTEKSRPGYLRLRELETDRICVVDDGVIRNYRNWFVQPDVKQQSQHGPAYSIKMNGLSFHDIDHVPYFSCSSWPPIAKSWIDRKRPSNWPSKETIQTIVSNGCRIVHKPHGRSEEKETEFRFSFSEAEGILFGTLTCDQRKCFIAFKALIKYSFYKLEYKMREDINLSSYCLKTIFLWACETIPVDHWQTTNGWSKCLLYMIDNLYACVKAGNLSGYFIPKSNLLENMEKSGPLLVEIESLRSHPIAHAAIFSDATKCFRGFHSNIYHHSKILCRAKKVTEIVLIEQLIFLQRIVAETNVIRGCLFWKKVAVLKIFAKWCKQNSNEIGLELWQCLTNKMTLFDVVYLDIVHGFDVSNKVLLEYVDTCWSADFICRLGSCYYEKFDQVENSILCKSLLMMQHAFDRDYPTIATYLACISTLIKHEEFEIAIRALESGAEEMLKSDEIICLDNLDSVVNTKRETNFVK